MADDRLPTELIVQAWVRQGSVAGIFVTVAHRGEGLRGSVLVKINRLDGTCTVLAETRDAAGAPAWLRATGAEPVAEADADAYIQRNRRYDPDLWVVEVEDRQGRVPFDARIL